MSVETTSFLHKGKSSLSVGAKVWNGKALLAWLGEITA